MDTLYDDTDTLYTCMNSQRIHFKKSNSLEESVSSELFPEREAQS